jgi:hypothetical protein
MITIPASAGLLSGECFSSRRSLELRLPWTENEVLDQIGLVEIFVLASIETVT